MSLSLIKHPHDDEVSGNLPWLSVSSPISSLALIQLPNFDFHAHCLSPFLLCPISRDVT